ncbi:MAG: transglycosylase SLT domain-containing protein [Desulfobacteraceae bacterium]|jgi:hypothetical protein
MRWQKLLIFLGLLFPATVSGASLEPADFPSLISSLEISKPLEFCGERVPMEVPEIRERFEKELLLTLWDRPQVILWLKRSRRYLPHIERILRESRMPADIKYIAIAESALRPHVGSQKGAIGFWQFRRSTGQKYGLVINSRIDERRNLFASTKAAIRYIKELHQIFGSWTLTAAAFNMGEDGLRAEILEQGTRDYYNLYLPLETQRFIFRILSVKLILSDPVRYGFKLSDQQYYPPLEFDSVLVDCFQETPIRILAQAAKTHFKVIKDLNPEIRGYYLAPGSHKIHIPKGASAGFRERYQVLVNKFTAAQKGRIYVVQKGDNLSSIAERFGIPLASLIISNQLDIDSPIHPGDRLIIHRDPTKTDELPR